MQEKKDSYFENEMNNKEKVFVRLVLRKQVVNDDDDDDDDDDDADSNKITRTPTLSPTEMASSAAAFLPPPAAAAAPSLPPLAASTTEGRRLRLTRLRWRRESKDTSTTAAATSLPAGKDSAGDATNSSARSFKRQRPMTS